MDMDIFIQGALFGMICGCVAGMTMFIGSMSLRRPAYLSGFLDVSGNSCPVDCDFSPTANTTYISVPPPNGSSSVNELHGIDNFYAISVYYLAAVAFLFTLPFAVIASLVTGK